MPSRNRRRRPGRRRAAVLHPTRPRPARPAARPQRSKRPTASRTSGILQEFRDSGAPMHVLERCALPGCDAPPAPRPHRCPSSSLTTPCRSRRIPRALPPSISSFGPWRGRWPTWRSCSSSIPATKTSWPGYGSCGAAQRIRSHSKLESPPCASGRPSQSRGGVPRPVGELESSRPPLARPRRRPRRVETVGDLFLFAQTDLVRNNPPVVAGGRITAHPRWSRVRRKWVQPSASHNPPDAEGEAADAFDRPQAVDGRLTRKELIS